MFAFFSRQKKQSIIDLEALRTSDDEDDYVVMETRDEAIAREKKEAEELVQQEDKELFRMVDEYQTIASMRPESVEEILKRNFNEYFKKYNGRLSFLNFFSKSPISSHIVDKIIERIKLDLNEEDLLFGVNKILKDHKVEIENQESFENFIVGCKLFYQIRKHFSVATSSVAINKLELLTRLELNFFHLILRQHISNENFEGTKKVKARLQKSDPILNKLKIKNNFKKLKVTESIWFLESKEVLNKGGERIFKNYGLANCGVLTQMASEELLRIKSNRKFNNITLKYGDHAFGILYVERACSNTNDHYKNGAFIDIWSDLVRPVEQIDNVLRSHYTSEEKYLNLTKPASLKKDITELANPTKDELEFDRNDVYDQAVNSLEALQQAAEKIVADIDLYRREEDNDKVILSFLTKKSEDLMSFSDDIGFVIQQVSCGNVGGENISVIKELNEQIENFYNVLFCKILRAPMGSNMKETDTVGKDQPVTVEALTPKPFMHSKLFDNQLLPAIKNILWNYARYADQMIEMSLSNNMPDYYEQDVVIDIDNASDDSNITKTTSSDDTNDSEELLFQMNL